MLDRESLDGWLERIAAEAGTPAYVYFTEAIAARITDLRAAFGGRFALSYAVKANPNPALLAWLADRVEALDVSSIGEYRLAAAAGWNPGRASFTGPGKRGPELREAIATGIGELIVESPREAATADRIAGGLGLVQDVLVRIAPSRVPKGFGDQMAGRPSAFGIDIEDVDRDLPQILALDHLRVVGFHIYSGTQCLKPEALVENYRTFLATFSDLCGRYAVRPRKLVFGSGLGIRYHESDQTLDLGAVATGIEPDLDAFCNRPGNEGVQLVLELGRYLVGEAGYFLTRVVGVKESRGARIAICDGGMNNHLPASGHFGMVIHRNYPMHKVGGGAATEKVDIVGPLCTSIDRIASGAMLPRLEPGDLVAVHSSGAYGPTASPLHFIGHPPPLELLVDGAKLSDVSWLKASGAPPVRPAERPVPRAGKDRA
jgi:diaminopimelate decarboxylase